MLRARGACRGPRAKPAGRGCAPARHDLPAPTTPRGSGRQGAGAGGAGVRAVSDRDHQEDGTSRCPGAALHRKAPERPPVPGLLEACLCWRQSVPHWVEKITGLRGARSGVAPWGTGKARPDGHRAGPLRSERVTERNWRSQVPDFRDGLPECSKASFGPRTVSPEPVPMSRVVVCLLLGWLWLTGGIGGVLVPSKKALRLPDRGLRARARLRGLWLEKRLPQFCQLVPSHSLPRLVHPRESSRSVRALPHCLIYLWHIPAVFQEGFVRGGALWLETSV